MQKLTTLFLFVYANLVFAQEDTQIYNSVKVTYKVSLNKLEDDVLKKDENLTKDKVFDEYSKMIQYASELIEFKLLYFEKKSIYKRNSFSTPEHLSIIQKRLLNGFKNSTYYRDFDNEYFIRNTNFLGKNFSIINENKIEWELLNETKIINGFLCFKAKRGLSIVWYCPDLNFQIGPEDYHNLPGLVLEINHTLYSIYCEKLSFQLNENDINQLVEPIGEYITEAEFAKFVEKAKSSYVSDK